MITFDLLKEYATVFDAGETAGHKNIEEIKNMDKYKDLAITILFPEACGIYTFDEAVTYLSNCDKGELLLKRLIEIIEAESKDNELC